MRDEEHFDKFVRPRSFSDTSSSNVDHSYLKSLRDKIRGQKRPDLQNKTPMTVLVCRETEHLPNTNYNGRYGLDRPSGSRSNVSSSQGQSLFARSKSTGILFDEENQPQAKPKLPQNYKLYTLKSRSVDYSSGYDRQASHKNKQDCNIDKTDKGIDGANGLTKHDQMPGVRQGRLSDSDISVRRSSVVYRYRDTKLQTELLQKELLQLRSSEHVKKQSEAVKQLLRTDKPNATRGNRVRFSGDFNETSQRFNVEHKTQTDLNLNGAKKILKQSKSLELDKYKPKMVTAEMVSSSKHNNIVHNSLGYPQSGTSLSHGASCSNFSHSEKPTTKELAQTLKNDLDQELLQPRRGIRQHRGQGQSRSKSESVINRTSIQRSKSSVGEYGLLNSDQKNAQVSRSTSNLRRKYDTITKYTGKYSEIEKKRERVRANLDRKKAQEQIHDNENDEDFDNAAKQSNSMLRNKFDTIRKFNKQDIEQKRERVRENYLKNWRTLLDQQSDEEKEDFSQDTNKSTSDFVYRKTKPNRTELEIDKGLKDSRISQNQNQSQIQQTNTNVRPDKLVSDNRSDEEKYAALSRHKIIHAKSSSLDSNLNPPESDNDGNRFDHTHKKFGVMGITSVQPENTKNPSTYFPNSYSSASNVHRVRNEAYSDSETVVKGSKPLTAVEGPSKLVVRQCRIGTSVAFGLIGVTQKEPNGNGYLDGQGLVTIRMIPDEQGRFGFNVKGGADQGMPIIVSRVAPNTPADNAIPRLNEGDQVLYINGRDVSQHTHEQVVLYIRQSRETRSKDLILIVRPNAYSAEDNCDEPDLTYDPETHQISSAGGGANALDLSLKLLEESLESGAALAQFEQLYRKKPGMTMNAARLEINVPKNRYRDISPYDQTRVIMNHNPSGDYINANYVNMEIPLSGIVNRYIAAQGPLPTTSTDFWQMIWEQQSTLVVMLTTKVEKGRIKCHQYWPDLYETSDYGHLQITCVKEEETSVFAFREYSLTNVESQEERHISHMQYIAWPDHGVPDDPVDFLEFVTKVRQKRVGIVEPIIVHCSAGIGRTGVLITMETAMCLTEANQPVYPLSIVRQMRDQRAMLIQTANQYKFVCEAIIRAYNEGIVKPLPEYSQR